MGEDVCVGVFVREGAKVGRGVGVAVGLGVSVGVLVGIGVFMGTMAAAIGVLGGAGAYKVSRAEQKHATVVSLSRINVSVNDQHKCHQLGP